jgi:hypothetical protein
MRLVPAGDARWLLHRSRGDELHRMYAAAQSGADPGACTGRTIGVTDLEATALAPRYRSLLVLHGASAALVGLLGGLGFLFNILRFIEIVPFVPRIRRQVPGTEAAWRAAHTGPIMNGLLAIGVGASGSMIELNPRAQRGLVATLIVTLWGNVIGYNAAAVGGERGLTPRGGPLNKVAYVGFLAAAISVLVSVPLMIVGVRRHRRDDVASSAEPEATDDTPAPTETGHTSAD